MIPCLFAINPILRFNLCKCKTRMVISVTTLNPAGNNSITAKQEDSSVFYIRKTCSEISSFHTLVAYYQCIVHIAQWEWNKLKGSKCQWTWSLRWSLNSSFLASQYSMPTRNHLVYGCREYEVGNFKLTKAKNDCNFKLELCRSVVKKSSIKAIKFNLQVLRLEIFGSVINAIDYSTGPKQLETLVRM